MTDLTDQDDELDFERAQFEDPDAASMSCAVCEQAIAGRHYSVNGQAVCEGCLVVVRQGQEGSLVKALSLGVVAGAVGVLICLGIWAWVIDLALVTIVIGILVGMAVRRGGGGRGRGSVMYRVMAVAITYGAMCSVHVPVLADAMVQGVNQSAAEQVAEATAIVYLVAGVMSLVIPFSMMMEVQILGLIIFAVGLWEAWRFSAAPTLLVEGPFGDTDPPPEPASVESSGSSDG